MRKPLEGDYLETWDGTIFAVKGFLHPPGKAVAYPKYYPNPHGERFKAGKPYRKLESLEEFHQFLREKHPEYLRFDPVFGMEVPTVPLEEASTYYSPRSFLGWLKAKGRLSCLDEVEADCLEMVSLLSRASGVPEEFFGVSGSTMLGVHRQDSDIDITVYGEEAGWRVYRALGRLLREDSPLKAYDEGGLRRLWSRRFKDTRLPFQVFRETEKGRRLEGLFKGREYFIRLLNPPSGEYGEARFQAKGKIRVEATVARGSQPIFTPCIYRLEDVKVLEGEASGEILEVYSLRGRFCEVAWEGDRVIVSGKLEEVLRPEGSYLRIVLGGSRDDHILPAL